MSILKKLPAQTGDFDAVAAGDAKYGSAVHIGLAEKKVEDLVAELAVDAETNTITLAAKWQGSDDKSTWVDLAHEPQNPAAVVLATGTGGADAAVTKAIAAPDGAYGYQYARVAIVVGVTTGTTSDTYSITYRYRQLS
jgi:hypothetical protein